MVAVRAGQGPLKPGESDSVTVYVDTAGKNGKLTTGVRMFTNDPGKHSLVLVIKARVVPPKKPAPAVANTPQSTPE